MKLGRLFKFRNMWIGIAMLWILFFHSGFWVASDSLRFLKNVGYGGVDICLFASGIGCYFSLEKDPDSLRFLKRRLKRLGPTYFCFIIPWLFWKSSVSVLPLQAILGNLLGIQTLATWEYHFNWYISGLVVYYFSMPYLKQITDSCKHIWQDVLIGVFLIAVSINFWKAGDNVLIFTRMPVLYAGLVFAKLAKQGYVVKKGDCFILAVITISGVASLVTAYRFFPDILWTKGLHWYPFALIVPGSCMFLSVLAEQIEKVRGLKWINKCLEIVGLYSFELYLVQVFLYENLMPEIMDYVCDIPNNLLWMMTLPVVALGTYLLNRTVWCIGQSNAKQNKKA